MPKVDIAWLQRPDRTGKSIKLIVDGSSIETGSQATPGFAYPTLLAAKLQSALVNLAVDGNTFEANISGRANQVDAAKSSNSKVTNICLIGGPTNDIKQNETQPHILWRLYKAYAAAREANGIKFLTTTILPRVAATVPATFELYRNTWNGILRGQEEIKFLDFAAIPEMADAKNLVIYVDGVHPANYGNELMARFGAIRLNEMY